uniref:Uncharacterized protein n=1 Tax=Sphaerodactylus townsendi TaxID=933632 RepID=A0ACB8FXP6_9SAUR
MKRQFFTSYLFSNSGKSILKEELHFGTKAHKWIAQQGPDPWAADAFDCPDPLTTFLENFAVLCKAKKWGRSNKAATAAWGLFNALQASTSNYNHVCNTIQTMTAAQQKLNEQHATEIRAMQEAHAKEHSVLRETKNIEIQDLRKAHEEEVSALTETKDRDIQNLNKAHDKELAALKETKDIEIQNLNKDHDQKIREKDVQIETLKKEHRKEIQTQAHEIAGLNRDNLTLLVTSRTHQAAADELRETQQLLNKRDQEISNLTGQLNDTQSAARFMAKENRTKIQEADHSACLQEIATLKRQFVYRKPL